MTDHPQDGGPMHYRFIPALNKEPKPVPNPAAFDHYTVLLNGQPRSPHPYDLASAKIECVDTLLDLVLDKPHRIEFCRTGSGEAMFLVGVFYPRVHTHTITMRKLP
jgi:hypothetical protein